MRYLHFHSLKRKSLLALLLVIVLGISACGGNGAVSDGNGNEEGSSGNGSGDKPVVKIGYLPITHAVPLYIMDQIEEETGFSEFELELVKFGSWPDLVEALNAGRIHGASMLVTLAMAAKEQGIDLKAVALGHRDGNVLIGSRVSDEINEVADLKGKNFAIPHKFSTHNILLYRMLKEAGLDYEDVNAIELAPPEMPAALSEGRISGYVVAEPFGAISVVMDTGKVLFQSEDIWMDSVDCALVLRGDFINSSRSVAEELVEQYVTSGEIAEKKDKQTVESSQVYMDVKDEVMDLSLKWISYDDLRLNKEAYEELTHYLVEMGLSENPAAYEDFVDNSLIDRVQ